MENFLIKLFKQYKFDLIFIVIFNLFVIQCFIKGFSLSLISFMKWILSTVVTIILVPKLQP